MYTYVYVSRKLCSNVLTRNRFFCKEFRFRRGFVLTVLVFTMQHSFASSGVVTKPMTAMSMVGGSVRMACSRDQSHLPVDWEFAPADTNNTSFIYTNRHIAENFTSKYKIDTDNVTRYDIVIDSADSSHAGTYICTPVTEGGADAPSASAQLIVLGIRFEIHSNFT